MNYTYVGKHFMFQSSAKWIFVTNILRFSVALSTVK